MRPIVLQRASPGFFIDARNRLYFSMREFLACAGHPDTPEARFMVMLEIRDALDGLPFIEIRGRIFFYGALRRRKRGRKQL